MKRALLVLIVSATAVAWLDAAALTPEQTLDRRSIGELEASPDGSRVVFTVTEPVTGTSRARAIWLLDVAAGRARQLTFSGKSDSSPRWAPDGSAIAFLSDRDGTAQLYRLSLSGGEAEKLTDRKDSITAFRWSPDGKRIALLMPDAKPAAQQAREKDKDDARIVDKERRLPRVWLLDTTTRSLAQATSLPYEIRQIEWLGNDRLAAAATATPASDQWTEKIYTVDLTGAPNAAFTESLAIKGPFGGLSVGPDGRTIAYIGARVDGPDAHDLYIANANVTAKSIDRPVSQARWIDDTTVMAIVARGFKNALATITRDGRPQFVDTDVNPTSYARLPNGSIVFAGESTTRAPEIFIKPPTAAARAVTSINDKWASLPVVAPEFVTYKSFDGTDIEAELLRPSSSSPQPQPSGPFVVLVHGGPTGRWSDAFEPWGQLLAQRGYTVLYPNIRGSVGYGFNFVAANRADWGGGDFKDVMAAVDWAIARGLADPNRLGIGGWSYGGYMSAWAVTQTTRFKAAVSGAPVIDMASEFGTENGSAYDEWFYGTPYEKLDGFIKSSPMTYVKNARTPTLLLQGEDDTTDPIGQSQQFYRGLKRYGVESDLVLYPREGHGLREEKHLLDRLNRIVAWYDKFLKPASTSTSQP
ncbi:MAG TPA: S9 family peptidase [Vicinamibacterales bacterium]|nr:S9 family peptidase [Vicinamibacterales bacterium]